MGMFTLASFSHNQLLVTVFTAEQTHRTSDSDVLAENCFRPAASVAVTEFLMLQC